MEAIPHNHPPTSSTSPTGYKRPHRCVCRSPALTLLGKLLGRYTVDDLPGPPIDGPLADLDVILTNNADQLGGATALHFALLQRLPDRQAEADRHRTLRDKYRVAVIPYDNHAEIVPFLEALARA